MTIALVHMCSYFLFQKLLLFRSVTCFQGLEILSERKPKQKKFFTFSCKQGRFVFLVNCLP